MVKDWNKTLRPRDFKDIRGLSKIVQTLQYMLAADSFPHVCLFHGPSGIGKSCVAEICAKALVCTGADSDRDLPCNECASCKSFNEGHSTNIQKYNMPDLKSKEDIDGVLTHIFRTAGIGRRVFILEEVQGMDQKTAQDRFLEDLTKVPNDVYIIMCTTQVHALSSTFRNRATEYYFATPSDAECIDLIKSIGVKLNLILPDDNLLRVFVRANRNVPRKIVGCLENFAAVSDFSEKAINEFFDLQSRVFYEDLFCALIDKDVPIYEFVRKLKGEESPRPSRVLDGMRDFVMDVILELSLGEYQGIKSDALARISSLLQSKESILYQITECLGSLKEIEIENDNVAFFQLVRLKLSLNNVTLRSAIAKNSASSGEQRMQSLQGSMSQKVVSQQKGAPLSSANRLVGSASDLQGVLGEVPTVQ